MEEETNLLESLFEKAESYGKTSYELAKLKFVEKTADVISIFVSRFVILFAFSIFFVVASIGVAFWLGEILGKTYYGFFCVAAFYGVVAIVLYLLMGDWIKKRVSNSIILQTLN